jgi:copper resistance protein D
VTTLAICRFAHFIAAMMAFGASAFMIFCAPAELRRALAAKLWPLVSTAAGVALITAAIWLSLETASMADDWSAAFDAGAILQVLSDTEFGNAWIAHLALAVALVGVVFIARAQWAAVALVSGLLLASLALTGHATMRTGAQGDFQRLNHAVHLLCAGGWLGGLVPFVLCVGAYGDDTLRRSAVRAMARFSTIGQFAVAALVLTGVINIALISGRPPWPPSTPYRALLDLKIVLVAAMVGLALVNRFVIVPRLAGRPRGLAALRATSLAEATLGTIVVALVSVFGLFDPS